MGEAESVGGREKEGGRGHRETGGMEVEYDNRVNVPWRQVQRNRERASAIRRAERRERFALYNEELRHIATCSCRR